MELNYVITILDRARANRLISICSELELSMVLTILGRGTATSEHLDLYGLKETEKAVVSCVADAEKTRQLFRTTKRRMLIDIPGNGVMMAVPIKSVGGGRTLAYLTNNAAPDNQTPQMEFSHELILIILNRGYMDDVMDAAREAGAGGGTVIHARGTGAKYAQKFFGVSLAEEKELIMIAAPAAGKANIMKAVAAHTGPESPAGAIAFSLPISSVAGLRQVEADY